MMHYKIHYEIYCIVRKIATNPYILVQDEKMKI